MCPGDLIVLSPGIGFNNYLWSDGSVLSFLNVSIPGNYSVTVTNSLCTANSTIFIDECGSEIWVPNVFTPNGDGVNEIFSPVYTNIDNITLYIFNRWGNQLYEGTGKSAVWDGKYSGEKCSNGVYYYLIEYENKGKTKGMRQLHGSVTLLN
jgi:gliding motility-associated-like protein